MLSMTILARSLNERFFVILLSDDNRSYIHIAVIAVCFFRTYSGNININVYFLPILLFSIDCRRTFPLKRGESIKKIFDSIYFV